MKSQLVQLSCKVTEMKGTQQQTDPLCNPSRHLPITLLFLVWELEDSSNLKMAQC